MVILELKVPKKDNSEQENLKTSVLKTNDLKNTTPEKTNLKMDKSEKEISENYDAGKQPS